MTRYDPEGDDEEFCPDCFAGTESCEHHERCVAPARELEDWLCERCHFMPTPDGACICEVLA